MSPQIGRRIRELRESRNWLQRDLAKAAGLPLRTIGRLERGEVDVRLSTLQKITKALDAKLSEITKGL
jgi:transcriptional regulator with XRE-family HTH domain